MTSRKRQIDETDDPSSPLMPPSSPALPYEEDDENELGIADDVDDMEELMDDEDLMGDNMMADYRSSNQQDTYDMGSENIDDNQYSDLDAQSRRIVEQRLNARDALEKNKSLYLDDEESVPLDENGLPIQRRRRRHHYADDMQEDEMEIDPLAEELSLESLADVKAPSIAEWIIRPEVTRTIARELKSFLLEYTDSEGRSVYGSRIRILGEVNAESLEVSYAHLMESKAVLALFLVSCPDQMLKIFDLVAMEATELHYPDYAQIHSELHVRITSFPRGCSLRELREPHLNSLVKVGGIVTRRTGVFPQLKYVKFDCLKCAAVLGPYFQDSNTEVKINFCNNCQSRGPFRINTEKTLYRNYQRLTLQESPSEVPAGRLPRHRDVILLWDLVDSAKPGEEVEIVGIYRNSYDGKLNAKNGFPVFATVIEANCVKSKTGTGASTGITWTKEEEDEFYKFSRTRGVIDKIISSMAPSIYGHNDIKTAVACSLFGGVPKDVNGKHSIRGDINVLLLGDPGTAKSQILKYVEKTSHRAVFATGQGASAVGLTASVRKDTITQEWTLEGGALVLADKGTCLIDEFDKMNDQDRTSIHEAMEQQSISISKAGIVTSLQARCAIIAAANPVSGRYNSTLNLSQNVNLTEPILSRFDILCVVRDLVDPEVDERLAQFVVDSHTRSHPLEDGAVLEKENEISPIPQEFLAKYIHYARTKMHPKLNQMDMDKVSKVYADLRRESISTGSFPITVRHLESILRIAESFAKMRLSEFVSSYDLDRAIKVTVDSFIGAQKVSVRRQLQRSFMKYTLPR